MTFVIFECLSNIESKSDIISAVLTFFEYQLLRTLRKENLFMITFESTCTMITTQTMTCLCKIEVIARVKLSRASMNKNEHDGCDRPYLVDGSH